MDVCSQSEVALSVPVGVMTEGATLGVVVVETVDVTDTKDEDVEETVVVEVLDVTGIVPLTGRELDELELVELVNGIERVWDGPRETVLLPATEDVEVGRLPVPLRIVELVEVEVEVLNTEPVPLAVAFEAKLDPEMELEEVVVVVGNKLGRESVGEAVVPFVLVVDDPVADAIVELESLVEPPRMLERITPRPEDEASEAVAEDEEVVEARIDEPVPVPANVCVLVVAEEDEPEDEPDEELEELVEADPVADVVDVDACLVDEETVVEDVDEVGSSPLKSDDRGLASVEVVVDDVEELDVGVGAVDPPKPLNESPIERPPMPLVVLLLLLPTTFSCPLDALEVLELDDVVLDTTPPGPNVIPLLVVGFLDVDDGDVVEDFEVVEWDVVGWTTTIGRPEDTSEAAPVGEPPTITVRETTTVVTSDPLDSEDPSDTPSAVVSSLNTSLIESESEGRVVVSRGVVRVRVVKVELRIGRLISRGK